MRAIPTLKISISGVRGVVGESLTPTLLVRFAEAFGTFTGSSTIVIGRDTRTSGEMVRQAVFAGLLSTGCRVIDLGICPVPTVQLLVRQLNARGGIAITASHNPAEWNALKFIDSRGLFLTGSQARQLLDIYHQGDYRKVSGADLRTVETLDTALDRHIKAITEVLGTLPANGPRPRVAVDSCNGAGSIVAPRLLNALGADVFAINVTPDGMFPRGAEPVPENLRGLCETVKENGCDVGFAQDMDADRLAIVSEQGEPIGEELTLVLAAKHVLGIDPGPVVANLATTDILDSVAAQFGSPIFRSKIGEANVAEEMLRRNAIIGGEGNGGVIYPRINFGRDSLVGMSLVLHLLAKTGNRISELVAELPRSFMLKDKLPCRSDMIPALLQSVKDRFAGMPMDLRDGIKVFVENGWFLVRGSNTEPIVRVVVESKSEIAACDIFKSVQAIVRGSGLD